MPCMTDDGRLPPLQGTHHLKPPISDLDASLTFYQRTLGARRIPETNRP
jgi:catechol 2,3-dioxygenase-like lactoylglutathione lyase family enzyme